MKRAAVLVAAVLPGLATLFAAQGCSSAPPEPPAPSPQVVGEWSCEGYIASGVAGEIGGRRYLFLKTAGSMLSLPVETVLRVLDVTDPTSPVEVGSLERPGAALMPASGMALSGTVLYVSHTGEEHGGLWVVDVSDPTSPEEITLMNVEYATIGLALAGNHACIATFPAGRFLFIDISNPHSPEQVGNMRLSRTRPGVSRQQMACSGPWLYVVDGGRLDIVDISSPSSPQEVGFYVSPDWEEPEDVPAPQERTTKVTPSDVVDMLAPPGALLDVAVSEQYAYIAAGTSGLMVLDISDPAAPQQVAQIDVPERTTRVAVSGNLAHLLGIDWVEDFTARIRLVDVSDPLAPQLVGSCIEFTALPANQTAMSGGDYVYYISIGTVRVIDVHGSGSGG